MYVIAQGVPGVADCSSPNARQCFETWLFHISDTSPWEPGSHAVRPATYAQGLVLTREPLRGPYIPVHFWPSHFVIRGRGMGEKEKELCEEIIDSHLTGVNIEAQ